MMDIQNIRSFERDNLRVFDLVLYREGERSMVLSPTNGTTLCLDAKCADELCCEAVTDDLAFLLVQRGMASYEESRPVSWEQDCVHPTFFLIDLTKECNLQCIYCFRELDRHAPRIEKEQLSRICDALIGYCQEYHPERLSIQPWGGEPLLEIASIEEIRRRFDAVHLHPQIVIETNATLITPEIAAILRKNDIEVGVSIDGHALVHNVQRSFSGGFPSLNWVESGIENLRQAGYRNISSITVVTKNTLSYLEDIIRYFAEVLHLSSIKFNLMRKTNRNRNLALDLEEIDEYVCRLLDCMRSCYHSGLHIVEQNIAQRISNLLFRPCNNICNAHGCHGGYRMLSIDALGNVYPCEMSDDPSYRIGHVEEVDFSAMVQRAIDRGHEYFQTRQIDGCKDCPWLFFCRGGCRAAVKYDTGNPCQIDKAECSLNQALYPRLVHTLLTEPEFAHYLQNGEG